MLIICYRMEELVILYYGNFSILGSQAAEHAQRTGCLNRAADQTLQSQIFLDELHREHLGYSTAQKPEWGLFLLEHILHNMAAMWRKGHQRCSKDSRDGGVGL